MGGIPLITKKVRTGRESVIPAQYREELVKELIKVNITREIFLSCALIVMVGTILTVRLLSLDTQMESMYVSFASYRLHMLLLLVSMVFLLFIPSFVGAKVRNISTLRLTHILLNSSVLFLCSVIAVNNELADQRPFSYIIAMFCIGSLVLMPAHERMWIYIPSWTMYQIGLLVLVSDPRIIIQNFIFVTLLMVLSLIISSINYSAYVHNYLNRKTIEENNKELDRLYRITEENLLKRTEELNQTIELEKLRAAFFSNISHELRTPLNIIYSAEQMLDRTLKIMPLQTKQREIDQYMHIMRQNCYRLIRLIGNLIDITKIDAGYLQFNLKSCDIIKIVEDISLSVADYIEDKRISLTFDTEIEEKVILCDPDKIERIVLNLLSNSVKFTPEGGQVFVNIYDGEDGITLSVKDTGIGIPHEMEKLIFERFVQVDKTSTRVREGSGIGLSLAKSLVEMHGGHITVKSKLGEGSEFIAKIPAVQAKYRSSCEEYGFVNYSQNAEKISIEFSDIYD